MKTTLHKGTMADLNIYSANIGQGLLGWATFPKSTYDSMDGVVDPHRVAARRQRRRTTTRATRPRTRSATGSGSTTPSRAAVRATATTSTTPPAEASPAYQCPTGRDTCTSPGLDPIKNFMDYTYDSCMNTFTTGQVSRMQAQWTAYRAGDAGATRTGRRCAKATERHTIPVEAPSAGRGLGMSPRGDSLRWALYEFRGRLPSPTRLPGAGGVGYRQQAARLAAGGARPLPRAVAARLPRGRDAGRRQDDVRPACRHRAAERRHRPAGHRRGPHRAPQDPVGRRRRPGRHQPRPEVQQQRRPAQRRLPRGRRHVCPGGVAPVAAPRADDVALDARHPRRGAPRRRREELGRRHPRGVRARDPSAVADRHAVPLGHLADPVRHLRARRRGHARELERLHVRLRRGPARRRRAPGALHGLRRQHALAHQGRRRARGAPRRADDEGLRRARVAHGPRPQG